MAKVYCVAVGVYSDYSIIGIFSNKDIAEKLAKENVYDGRVEERDIDPNIELILQNYRPYYVRLYGENSEVLLCGGEYESISSIHVHPAAFGERDAEHSCSKVFEIYHLWARNENCAILKASEYRSKLIAMNLDIDWKKYEIPSLKEIKENKNA